MAEKVYKECVDTSNAKNSERFQLAKPPETHLLNLDNPATQPSETPLLDMANTATQPPSVKNFESPKNFEAEEVVEGSKNCSWKHECRLSA